MNNNLLAQWIEIPFLKKGGTHADVSANPLGYYIAALWRTVVIVGSLALLLFLIWGTIDWLMSEGDPEKLKRAKNKIIHAMAGMGFMAASYAIVKIVEIVFEIDIFKIVWPEP